MLGYRPAPMLEPPENADIREIFACEIRTPRKFGW